MTLPATFIHLGNVFEVVDEAVDFRTLSAGMWLRLSYDPTSSKPDEIGEVISIKPADVGWLGDYRIQLARDGDRNDLRDLLSHDGYFEIIRMK